jgi:hypothetical protein
MKRTAVTMTTIYGRTRLQITCDGEHVGWVDLQLGVTVVERLASDRRRRPQLVYAANGRPLTPRPHDPASTSAVTVATTMP